MTFGELLIVFLTKVNLLYLLYSLAQKCCLLHLIKENCKNFSKNSNLDDSGISLPVFPFRTNMRLYNSSITPNVVKKVITNLDSAKTSGPDCIHRAIQIMRMVTVVHATCMQRDYHMHEITCMEINKNTFR